VPGDILIPDAQPEEQINNGPNNVVLNYMFSQDWQLDPILLSHLERKRNAQFYRIWANYFAPASKPEFSVQIPKKWSPFFMSNLLHEDSFNWSKSFLPSDIPSALLEPESETHPFAIPKKCPDGKFLESVLSEESTGNVSALSDSVSHPVLEGKPNANHVRARISNSRTQQLHNMDIIAQCSNSIKKEIIVDYIICLRHPHSLYNKSKCGKET
jgi:hypothetical protein